MDSMKKNRWVLPKTSLRSRKRNRNRLAQVSLAEKKNTGLKTGHYETPG
jgi:hypothetical protein